MLIASLLLLCACGCSSLPERVALAEQGALMPDGSSRLDALVGLEEQNQDERSGFRLVGHGPEALAIRIHASGLADRSIDVQTYIWHADLTGLYLANELLLAADRGVRVRLLLDDLDARNNNYGFAALDAHPNIHVRLFNPVASRSGTWSLAAAFLRDGRRLNRRMHNKVWIVDNRIALGGGRNLGNEYFGASDAANFADLELAMAGPVVREASQSFDQFWNDEASYPIALLSPEAVNEQALQGIRETLAQAARRAPVTDYAALVASDNAVARLLSGDWALDWTDEYRFVSDEPSKVRQKAEPGLSRVLAALMEAMDTAEQSIRIVSPYFVPGREGSARLTGHAERLDSVSVLTNSLAANDVVAVHGGYSRYRKRLLKGGVGLWELKAAIGEEVERHIMPSSSASLHAKAASIDDSGLFVGSYNLDPRSTSLNSEQGIFVRSAELAGVFNQQFDQVLASRQTWALSLDAGDLQWHDGR
ncbi:MAG: phospholipase D family protein, partial [Wenzhouxiangella sp.]|nr:phospholipase D family protein [Wenzhouxiangella sp.]